MLPDKKLIDITQKKFEFAKKIPNKSIFGSDKFTAIKKNGRTITSGQYSLDVHPVIFEDGHVALNPIWESTYYKNFYHKYYAPLYALELKKDVGISGIVHNYNEIINFIKKNTLNIKFSKILEVGSGPGIGLNHICHNYNARGYAIESSRQSIKEINKSNLIKWSGHSLFNIDQNLNNIDICILRHVVEHMLNPIEELSILRKTISDSTLVYISVPDMLHPRIDLRDYNDWTKYWFRVPHIHYFNRFTLKEVLFRSGFDIKYIEECNNELRVVCTRTQMTKVNSDFNTEEAFITQLNLIESLLGKQSDY
jgi:2-polyprenyl-3-methyl-5-hydroxy-6-metoxy-1,4-benzoquinol methylase